MKRLPIIIASLFSFLGLHADENVLPRILNQWPPAFRAPPYSFTIEGDRIFITCVGASSPSLAATGLMVFDIADPSRPRKLRTLDGWWTPSLAENYWIHTLPDKTTRLENLADPIEPVLVSAAPIPYAQRIRKSGRGYEIIDNTLSIFDTSDPSAPTLLGSVETPDNQYFVNVSGHVLTLANYPTITFVDVSNPSQPTLGGSYSADYIEDAAVAGQRAYVHVHVAIDKSIFHILDISDLAHPKKIAEYEPDFRLFSAISASNNLLIANDWENSIRLLDVTDPANIREISKITTSGFTRLHQRRGDQLFFTTSEGVEIADISNPAAPRIIGSIRTGDTSTRIHLSKNSLVLGEVNSGLKLFDLTEPASPKLIRAFSTPYASAILALDSYIYAIAPDLIRVPNSQILPGVAQTIAPLHGVGSGLAHINGILAVGRYDGQVDFFNTQVDPPSHVGSTKLRGQVLRLTASDTLLFASSPLTRDTGVYSILDPTTFAILATIPNPHGRATIAANGNLFCHTSTNGLSFYDVTDGSNPQLKSTLSTGVYDLNAIEWLRPGFIAALTPSGNIIIINILNPAAPTIENRIVGLPYNLFDMEIHDGICYIPAYGSGLLTIDLNTTPATPQPTLEIHPDGEAHLIRWPHSLSGFDLYQSAGLNGPWSLVNSNYLFDAFLKTASVPSRGEPKFYQLRKP